MHIATLDDYRINLRAALLLLCAAICFSSTQVRAQNAEPTNTRSEESTIEREASQDADVNEETDESVVRTSNADKAKSAVRQLADADPQRRQSAAETLARFAPDDQMRLVQGYRLQERDPRVRLALDWALYRLGKPDALFGVVNALTTRHRNQAVEYLARLDDSATLVALLNSPKRAVKTGVLEALARNGDQQAWHAIEPLVASSDIEIAAAAQLALTGIERRQTKRDAAPAVSTRPRQVAQPKQP